MLPGQAPFLAVSPVLRASPGASELWSLLLLRLGNERKTLSPFLYSLVVTPARAAQWGQDRLCVDSCPSLGSEFSVVAVLPNRSDEMHLPRYKHGLCRCVEYSSRKRPLT